MKKYIFLLLGISVLFSNQKADAQTRELRFETKTAMYAANEEWLTFACEIPDGMVPLDLKHQSDMYWYSLYNLGNLSMRSGMGIHVVNSPLFAQHVKEDKGMPWTKGMNKMMKQRKFLLHKVAQFKAKSGAAQLDNMWAGYEPPKGAFPVYLEYSSGDPSFINDPNPEDFGSLRWDKKTFDKSMNPAAWGQTMMKQILWARDFFHENRVSNGVTYIGTGAHDGAHGFRGSMLIALALNKAFALKSTLAYNAKTGELGEVDPMTYDPMKGPIYYPHRYEVKFASKPMLKMMAPMMGVKGGVPPIPKKFIVTDKTSDLFDIASLLWATSEFYYFTDPTIENGFNAVFGDPMWMAKDKTEAEIAAALKDPSKTVFPKGKPHMLSKGVTVVNFKNIMGLHFMGDKGTLVDTWDPEKKKGKHITTVNAGMAVIALANVYHRLHDVKKVKMGAQKILMAQANFLLKQQDADGSIANGFNVGGSVNADKSTKKLESQTFAMRAWLSAYQISKEEKFLAAADKAYNYIQTNLWSESAQVYRTSVGATQSKYDGLAYGSVIGALRELAIAKKQNNQPMADITETMDKFFYSVSNANGMQIAEMNMTGEMIPSQKMAADMMAKMEELKKTDPEKAKKMQMKMMDSDKDGVPKPKFVKGTEKGAAPVMAASVTISTK
jgi:hypothetical protein